MGATGALMEAEVTSYGGGSGITGVMAEAVGATEETGGQGVTGHATAGESSVFVGTGSMFFSRSLIEH